MSKTRLCDELYERLIHRMKSELNRVSSVDAFSITWHLRLDWGYPTSKLNYEFSKLVKEGKLIKKSTRSYTAFSPVSLDGCKRERDCFTKII